MLSEYIIELIDKWERHGVTEDEMYSRKINKCDLDEQTIRTIINIKNI